MARKPPFMNAYGSIPKILSKIKQALTPDRFTQDFLATKLGFKGASPKAFIPFAKRLGLLGTDGAPTDLYKRFRNPSESKKAMAEAIRRGYSELFERNEYAYDLNRSDLEGLMMEITGLEKGNTTLLSICSSFENLKKFASFEKIETKKDDKKGNEKKKDIPSTDSIPLNEDINLNLAYTINLVLPKSDDVAVFNAIFRSLKENLLRK